MGDSATVKTSKDKSRKRRPSESAGESAGKRTKISTQNTESSSEANMSADETPSSSGVHTVNELVLQLSKDVKSLAEKFGCFEQSVDKRLAEQVSNAVVTAVNTAIEQSMKKLREEFKKDIDSVSDRVARLEQSYAEVVKGTKAENSVIVIRNLPTADREDTDPAVTEQQVNRLIRDGLKIPDVQLKKTVRKKGWGNKPGVVIATVASGEQKKKIMDNKKKLKSSDTFKRVFIHDDAPPEVRNAEANMRTVLRAVGKDNEFTFSSGRLVKKTERA